MTPPPSVPDICQAGEEPRPIHPRKASAVKQDSVLQSPSVTKHVTNKSMLIMFSTTPRPINEPEKAFVN